MNAFRNALSLRIGGCVAFVGAGGKTTLSYQLMHEIAADGARAVFTTTTNVWEPQPTSIDRLIVAEGSDAATIARALQGDDWHSAVIVTDVVGSPNAEPVPGAFWPTIQTKRRGLEPAHIDALRNANATEITWIVEADGARGLRIKAPGPTEPAIPPCADVVAVVACLDALGRPLDDRTAHRADRIAALTGCMPGAVITPPTLIALLAHPAGGHKSIPPGAHVIAVLTQHSDAALHPDALTIATELRTSGFSRVIIAAPRADSPLLAIV
ncbi:MAG: selenium cofactor biosynthesis protein YqeC [Chloroflexi bacterium]|nr:selenium cofactor biosynthesis protein YqeC [Chloroflexota bacterium]